MYYYPLYHCDPNQKTILSYDMLIYIIIFTVKLNEVIILKSYLKQ